MHSRLKIAKHAEKAFGVGLNCVYIRLSRRRSTKYVSSSSFNKVIRYVKPSYRGSSFQVNTARRHATIANRIEDKSKVDLFMKSLKRDGLAKGVSAYKVLHRKYPYGKLVPNIIGLTRIEPQPHYRDLWIGKILQFK